MMGWHKRTVGKSFTKIMAPLSMALKTWRNDCHTQIRSCGIILQLTELGEGMMKIESVSMGSIFHIQYANHGNYRDD